MKLLKHLLLSLLALLAIALIVAAFAPKKFHASGEITINRPQQEVFDYVKLIRNQGNYDNWSRQDPAIEKQYKGTDGTVGFTYTWKSKKVGDGKQVITHIEEGKRVDMDLFFNGSETANKSFIEVNPATATQSIVKWEIDGSVPFPFNLMTLFFDMNKDFNAGLKNLKSILEKE